MKNKINKIVWGLCSARFRLSLNPLNMKVIYAPSISEILYLVYPRPDETRSNIVVTILITCKD